jgi:hypothetical protein
MECPVIQLSRRTVTLFAVALAAALGLAASSFVLTVTRAAEAAEAAEPSADAPEAGWADPEIAWLIDSGIARGTGGTFRPTDSMDRQGAAFWLANYNETIALVATSDDPQGNSAFTGFATCPAGRRPVAGGGGTDEAELFMTDSRPSGPTEWSVTWETYNDFLVDPGEISVWALCVPNTIP